VSSSPFIGTRPKIVMRLGTDILGRRLVVSTAVRSHLAKFKKSPTNPLSHKSLI
jgi:hypothetical protein